MVTATAAPTTGADFVRLDLRTVVDSIQLLRDELAKTHELSDEQHYWFQRYLTAWDFYRPSQPESFQLRVEEAIADIFGNTIYG